MAKPKISKKALSLIILVCSISVIINLALWRLLMIQEKVHIKRTIGAEAASMSSLIKDRLHSRTLALQRMALRWGERLKAPTDEWEHDVSLFIAHQPEYRSIQWADSSYSIRWIVSQKEYRASGNIDAEFLKRNLDNMDLARRYMQPAILISNRDRIQGRDVVAYVPLFFEKVFHGGILGVLDGGELLDPQHFMDDEYGYSMQIMEDEREVYGRYSKQVPGDYEWAYKMDIELNNTIWSLHIWPSRKLLKESRSLLPHLVLAFGLFSVVLLTLTLLLAQRATRQARQLEQSTRDLARTNKELESFAYVASHDLQEPIRKITNYTELLKEKYQETLDEKADKYIGYIVDGARRMNTLINDLLTYSRTGYGKITLEEASLEDIVKQTRKNLDSLISESGAVIEYSGLPVVRAAPLLMLQLMQNLIGNAIKFRSDRRPEVKISAREENGGWHITVADNGIGIDPEFSKRIFVIFQRLHTQSEYAGTGIGLALCKKIVERHKGEIWVESETGKGSAFHFTIPA